MAPLSRAITIHNSTVKVLSNFRYDLEIHVFVFENCLFSLNTFEARKFKFSYGRIINKIKIQGWHCESGKSLCKWRVPLKYDDSLFNDREKIEGKCIEYLTEAQIFEPLYFCNLKV